jgi:hypothetical protein
MNTYTQTMDWLMESQHPSIRVAIRRILWHENPTLQETAALVDDASPIRAILNQMKEQTYWMHAKHFYSPKFKASHWSLLLLHEYGCPADLPEIQRACNYLLQGCRRWLDEGMIHRTKDHRMACFFGNVLRYCLAFGFQNHPTVREILDVLSHAKAGNEWTCKHNGGSPCTWGAIRTLWGYALLPEAMRTPAVQTSINSGIDLICHSHEMMQTIDYAPTIKQHDQWEKISFPLYYQSDRLFTLRVMAEHGKLNQDLLRPAIAWLAARRKKNGRWQGSNPNKSRSWPYGISQEDTDRWVSLHALSILQTENVRVTLE